MANRRMAVVCVNVALCTPGAEGRKMKEALQQLSTKENALEVIVDF